jgi:hypothetical protein
VPGERNPFWRGATLKRGGHRRTRSWTQSANYSRPAVLLLGAEARAAAMMLESMLVVIVVIVRFYTGVEAVVRSPRRGFGKGEHGGGPVAQGDGERTRWRAGSGVGARRRNLELLYGEISGSHSGATSLGICLQGLFPPFFPGIRGPVTPSPYDTYQRHLSFSSPHLDMLSGSHSRALSIVSHFKQPRVPRV